MSLYLSSNQDWNLAGFKLEQLHVQKSVNQCRVIECPTVLRADAVPGSTYVLSCRVEDVRRVACTVPDKDTVRVEFLVEVEWRTLRLDGTVGSKTAVFQIAKSVRLVGANPTEFASGTQECLLDPRLPYVECLGANLLDADNQVEILVGYAFVVAAYDDADLQLLTREIPLPETCDMSADWDKCPEFQAEVASQHPGFFLPSETYSFDSRST